MTAKATANPRYVEVSLDDWTKVTRERNLMRDAIDKIGANISGKMTAEEMQTIALACLISMREQP